MTERTLDPKFPHKRFGAPRDARLALAFGETLLFSRGEFAGFFPQCNRGRFPRSMCSTPIPVPPLILLLDF